MDYLAELTKTSGWGSPSKKITPKKRIQGLVRRSLNSNIPDFPVKLVQAGKIWNLDVYAFYSHEMESFAQDENGNKISLDEQGEVLVSSVDSSSQPFIWTLNIDGKFFKTDIAPTELVLSD